MVVPSSCLGTETYGDLTVTSAATPSGLGRWPLSQRVGLGFMLRHIGCSCWFLLSSLLACIRLGFFQLGIFVLATIGLVARFCHLIDPDLILRADVTHSKQGPCIAVPLLDAHGIDTNNSTKSMVALLRRQLLVIQHDSSLHQVKNLDVLEIQNSQRLAGEALDLSFVVALLVKYQNTRHEVLVVPHFDNCCEVGRTNENLVVDAIVDFVPRKAELVVGTMESAAAQKDPGSELHLINKSAHTEGNKSQK